MKREDWLKDIFPESSSELLTAYDDLAPREVPIVLVAANDAMLEHLLKLRMADEEDSKSLFSVHQALGDSGNRITFAYQLGLIDRQGMLMMRRMSNLRNLFAHRVTAKFGDDDVAAHVHAIYEYFIGFLRSSLFRPESEVKEFAEELYELAHNRDEPDMACALLICANAFLQSHFHARQAQGMVPRLSYIYVSRAEVKKLEEQAAELGRARLREAIQGMAAELLKDAEP